MVQIITVMKYRRTNTYLNVIGTLHIQLRHASNGESCKSNLKIQGTSVLECLCRQWKRQLWQWHPEIKNNHVHILDSHVYFMVSTINMTYLNESGWPPPTSMYLKAIQATRTKNGAKKLKNEFFSVIYLIIEAWKLSVDNHSRVQPCKNDVTSNQIHKH